LAIPRTKNRRPGRYGNPGVGSIAALSQRTDVRVVTPATLLMLGVLDTSMVIYGLDATEIPAEMSMPAVS
jgi:hypothetical protein